MKYCWQRVIGLTVVMPKIVVIGVAANAEILIIMLMVMAVNLRTIQILL